jgi:hypothetical protein
MFDNDESPMPLKDEIEDPIYEVDMPEEKIPKIRPMGVNLHRMLLGLCQDVEEGRLPSFHNKPLVTKTKGSKITEIRPIAKLWVKALEQEKLLQNQGAIYWSRLLEAFPNLLEGVFPEEVEEWALQLRNWRT